MSGVHESGILRDTLTFSVDRGEGGASVSIPIYAWHTLRFTGKNGQEVECWIAGKIESIDQLVDLFLAGDILELKNVLSRSEKSFGLIFRSGRLLFAVCDKVQSFPVFVELSGERVEHISADARVYRKPQYASRFRPEVAELFKATGYCLGTDTFLEGVRRLRPGEFCLETEQGLVFEKYYVYRPNFSKVATDDVALCERLGATLDNIIDQLISSSQGRMLLLPLSAGLDSRLLLGKLVERGCKRFQTFSYGSDFNMEAREAKKYADHLGVPWRFVKTRRRDVEDYRLGDGSQYVRFASGVHTSPALTEFYALKQLVEEGCSKENTLLINGQSGDFLTGGHLREVSDFADLSEVICRKHFSLGKKLGDTSVLSQEYGEYLKYWAAENQFDVENLSQGDLYGLHLCFEWQERQANYIINQQRAYDWFHLEWSLPLWSPILMDFYEKVPIKWQLDQKLYVTYLQAWNYKGIFKKLRAPYDPWPKFKMPILFVGRGLGAVFGKEEKYRFYEKAQYFSDQHYLYRFFDRSFYMSNFNSIRNPATLFALDGLSSLKSDLGVGPSGALEVEFEKRGKRS